MRLLLTILLSIAAQTVYAAPCHEKSFLEFFSKFAVDEGFSSSRTVWPLKVTSEQFGDKNTQKVLFIKSRSESWATELPIFEFLKTNPRVGVSVTRETKSEMILTFGIEDADILFDLGFQKNHGCWRLVTVREFDR